MGMGLSLSYGAVGAARGLEELLARRMLERQQDFRESIGRQEMMQRQQELQARQAQADADRAMAERQFGATERRLDISEKRDADMAEYRRQMLEQQAGLAGERNELTKLGLELREKLGLLGDERGRLSINVQAARAGRPSRETRRIKNDDGSFSDETWLVYPSGDEQLVNSRPAVTSAMVDYRAGLERSAPAIENLKKMSDEINQGSGLGARVWGGLRTVAGRVGIDPQMETFRRTREAEGPSVARSQGHTGVLTQKDVESALLSIPGGASSKEEAQALWTLLEGKRARQLSGGKPGNAGAKVAKPLSLAAALKRGRERKMTNEQVVEEATKRGYVFVP